MGQRPGPMPDSTDTLDPRRKRLLWRATHRGLKEMDLLLGGFAKARLAAMDEAELEALEVIIAIPDQELLTWATRTAPVPPEFASPLLLEMLAFRP
jgi:antitoxin CptB